MSGLVGRIVKDVVQRIIERTQVPNTYQLGEVCQIIAKDNPELRGKGGCWAIVSQVNEFSCTVRTWNGEYTVGLQHLKSCEYLPAECEQMQMICDRLSQVYSSSLMVGKTTVGAADNGEKRMCALLL